jgi:isoquinoline 1-oxidoreductase beta subunit
VACCAYGDIAAAEVAEVSVEEGRIRVHRVACALDIGPAVNPDAARAQVEGGIAMGLSWALHEEIRVEHGTRSGTGLDNYPILTLNEMPAVDTILLDDGPRLNGPSEIPLGPVAAAVANAVFALTGHRLRELPLRLPGVTHGG